MTRDRQRLTDYLGHMLEAIERIDRYVADIDEVVEKTVISKVLENAESGIVAVNRAPVPIAAEAPFLGWKDSGIGLPEHGRWDRDFYAKPQARY